MRRPRSISRLPDCPGTLQAMTAVVWAVHHADAGLEAVGRDRLRWLLSQ